jgi:hypothetical protein
MEKKKIEHYVKDKAKEYLRIIGTFQEALSQDNIANSTDASEIKALCKDKPETTHKEVADKLSNIQVRSWEMYIKDLDMTKFMRPLVEFVTMAELFEIELDFDEEDRKFYDYICKSYGSLFIEKNGRLQVIAEEQFAELKKMASDNSKQELNLISTFQSITEKA